MITSNVIQTLMAQKSLHSIQSWYEPALFVLNELLEKARETLKKRKYNEGNAAVSRESFRAEMQSRYRISIQMIMDIEKSIANAKQIEVIGAGYIRPLAPTSEARP